MKPATGLRRRQWLGAVAALPLAACRPSAAPEGGFAGMHPERGHLLRERAAAVRDPTPRRTQVVIAGGGVAGLAAARALRLAGIEDFVLLELEDQAGGNSRGGVLGGLACPLGAHYLPLPSDAAAHVQDLLEELGLRRRVAGRWRYDERHLCHSPQERLYFRGEWQEGVLPMQGVDQRTRSQYARFARRVAEVGRETAFAIPASTVRTAASHLSLDAIAFGVWLAREGFDDPRLGWYLDYCCRDDYGAGTGVVSAWAGLHYFASRHGFQAPGEGDEPDAVLTWPQGNAWLAQRLAAPLGDRVRTGRVVVRIAESKTGVEIDAVDPATGGAERWSARHAVVALPAFVAARVLAQPPAFVQEAARRSHYAPWIVTNLLLGEPLQDRPGAAPAWDNVVYGGAGLGYVDAGHQRLDPRPAPTVLTWYHAPGEAARRQLLQAPWSHWLEVALGDLAGPHPDLAGKIARVEVARYGHAMRIPVPGTRARLQGLPLRGPRLSFAHADWAGYSIFEEAYTSGHLAGAALARN